MSNQVRIEYSKGLPIILKTKQHNGIDTLGQAEPVCSKTLLYELHDAGTASDNLSASVKSRTALHSVVSYACHVL